MVTIKKEFFKEDFVIPKYPQQCKRLTKDMYDRIEKRVREQILSFLEKRLEELFASYDVGYSPSSLEDISISIDEIIKKIKEGDYGHR